MAYSLDLRKRIVAAVESGLETKREIAEFYDVHESFIYKLLRQQREQGHLAPLPHGGGASPKLTAADLPILFDLVAQTPDATLAELAQQLRKKTGIEVSQSTICRALQAITLTLKKRPSSPTKPTRRNVRLSANSKRRCP